MKIDRLPERALTALKELVQEIPFAALDSREFDVEAGERPGEHIRASMVMLNLPEHAQTLLLALRPDGEPRFAREAVNQLFRSRASHPGAYGIFVAPYISSRSAEICKAEDIGYIDFAGNCYLSFGRVFVSREGRPNTFNEKRHLRSLFSTKATRILRVLLNFPGKTWKMQHLAEEAEVSLGQVFTVKELLLDKEWVAFDREGLRITEPLSLLRSWADNYSYRRNDVADFYTMLSLEECEKQLAIYGENDGLDYAVTGFSGAARFAPSVKYNRIMMYVQGERELLIRRLNLKSIESGANVTLMEPYDKGVFYGSKKRDSIWVVSPVQLYLDLRGAPGRGQEAAEILFEEVIGKGW